MKTETNLDLFVAVAERYENMALGTPDERITTILDLEVTMAEFPEADLNVLLDFPSRDFAHDIFGIKNHINRSEMKIEGGFVPRFVNWG
jgi:hypothetical protein